MEGNHKGGDPSIRNHLRTISRGQYSYAPFGQAANRRHLARGSGRSFKSYRLSSALNYGASRWQANTWPSFYARNPMLMRYMENMDYTDHLGMGVPMIMREVKKLSGKEPLLEERDGEFCLIFFPKRDKTDV